MSKQSKENQEIYDRANKQAEMYDEQLGDGDPLLCQMHHHKSKPSSKSTEICMAYHPTCSEELRTVKANIAVMQRTLTQQRADFSSFLEEHGWVLSRVKQENQSLTQTQTQKQPQERLAKRELGLGEAVSDVGICEECEKPYNKKTRKHIDKQLIRSQYFPGTKKETMKGTQAGTVGRIDTPCGRCGGGKDCPYCKSVIKRKMLDAVEEYESYT